MKVEWTVSDENVNKLQNKWAYCKEKSVFYKRKGTQYDIKFGKAIEGKVWRVCCPSSSINPCSILSNRSLW